jgi:D-alanyl-lipoteichoic acid acyltransferase DltB (MBOAT superfamily)
VLFTTTTFFLFLGVVLAGYYALAHRWQNRFLLLASYVFYGFWDPRFLSLLVLSTVVDFVIGRALPRTQDERRRRLLLGVSVATNLGILATFKYLGFFADAAASLLTNLGLAVHPPTLAIILPVGISFYTFQTLSYTVDVYRRRIEPERDPVTFALYVAFFPQLVAGPIERAGRLLPQLRASRQVTGDDLAAGITLITTGLILKVAIADVVGGHVGVLFARPEDHGSLTLLAGALLFSLQIYGDFAGYSQIARGVARLLGIELMANFDHPYLSRSCGELWRRWHISLSSWLRDYLYIPLGGSRGGHLRMARNLLLTMLLGGLWHGAAWTFVVWGAIHGVALAVERQLQPLIGNRVIRGGTIRARLSGAVGWLAVGTVWTASMVVFRADSLSVASGYLGGILSGRGPIDAGVLVTLAYGVILLALVELPAARRDDPLAYLRTPRLVRGAALGAGILLILTTWSRDHVPFIYFQF